MTLHILFMPILILGSLLAIPAHADSPKPIKVKTIEFTSTPAPSNTMEMTNPYTRSQAVGTLADDSKRTYPLTFQALQRSGDYVGGWYYGLVVNKNGEPILQSPPNSKGISRAVLSFRLAPTASRCWLSPMRQ